MTVDELASEIKRLSPTERENLYQHLGVVDQAKWRGAEIRIDDWQGKDKVSPRATIEYADGTAETIDIIASIQANAVSLSHPAMLCAIQRWEEAVVYSNALIISPPYLPSRANYVELAKKHLKRLSAALLNGAKKRRIPKELAVDLFVVKLGLQDDYVVLHKAWEWLGETEIKTTRNTQQKLKKIESLLRSDWRIDDKFKNVEIPIGKLQNQPCVQIQPPLVRTVFLTDFLDDLQEQFTTSVLHHDEERLQQYLDFLKSEPDAKKRVAFSLKSEPDAKKRVAFSLLPRLTAMQLIPEVQDLLKKKEYVASLLSWDGSDLYWFEFEDGSKAGIKIADAMDILNIKSEKLRKELAIAFGLKDCVTNYPGSDFLNKSRADVVGEFLQSKSGKAFLSERKSWQVFANAFDAWRLPLANRSLQKYRSKSKQYVRWMIAKEKERAPNYWGIDVRNSLKFVDTKLPPHYHALFGLTKKYDGRALLPTWFNIYDSFKYISNPLPPVITTTSEV
jgi:hypothetical protein